MADQAKTQTGAPNRAPDLPKPATTVELYLAAILEELRAQGKPVEDIQVVREPVSKRRL